jgi:hypothetical protein
LGAPTLLTLRSATGRSAAVSAALLFPGSGSSTPAGGATVAVLVSVPVALGAIVATTVKVTLAPAGRSTVVAMSPLPLGAAQAPPPVAPPQVQRAPLSAGGSASTTAAPGAACGTRAAGRPVAPQPGARGDDRPLRYDAHCAPAPASRDCHRAGAPCQERRWGTPRAAPRKRRVTAAGGG